MNMNFIKNKAFLSVIVIIIIVFFIYNYGNTKKLTIYKDENIGNTMENFQNLGWFAQDANNVYSISFEHSEGKLKTYISKADFDGKNKVLLCEANALDLNIVDGWIYYKNLSDDSTIYKVDVNGQNNQKISDISAASLVVYKDTLYVEGTYAKYNNNLYAMDTDGGNIRMISDERVLKIYFYNDNIYYTHPSVPQDFNTNISKMDLDGNNNEVIASFFGGIEWWTIYNDNIFYVNQTAPTQSLKKVSIGGTGSSEIISIAGLIPWTVNSNKSIIYYTTSKDSIFALGHTTLHQYDLETGKERTRNVPIKKKSRVGHVTYSDFLIHDKIFRIENGEMFIMDSDGKNIRPF